MVRVRVMELGGWVGVGKQGEIMGVRPRRCQIPKSCSMEFARHLRAHSNMQVTDVAKTRRIGCLSRDLAVL